MSPRFKNLNTPRNCSRPRLVRINVKIKAEINKHRTTNIKTEKSTETRGYLSSVICFDVLTPVIRPGD
ncbi:hypothetical protein ABEB36_008951 [Hypothenemus hampei]|uniref:Uncharacterized protein n=1 Tax=Hypothenemus hampei TaxID=57062 RepID=A0ABD1ESM2_HYPHA